MILIHVGKKPRRYQSGIHITHHFHCLIIAIPRHLEYPR